MRTRQSKCLSSKMYCYSYGIPVLWPLVSCIYSLHEDVWCYKIEYTYMKTRCSFYHAPCYDVYKFGVKEVPNGAGKDIAVLVSRLIEQKMEKDLWQLMYDE